MSLVFAIACSIPIQQDRGRLMASESRWTTLLPLPLGHSLSRHCTQVTRGSRAEASGRTLAPTALPVWPWAGSLFPTSVSVLTSVKWDLWRIHTAGLRLSPFKALLIRLAPGWHLGAWTSGEFPAPLTCRSGSACPNCANSTARTNPALLGVWPCQYGPGRGCHVTILNKSPGAESPVSDPGGYPHVLSQPVLGVKCALWLHWRDSGTLMPAFLNFTPFVFSLCWFCCVLS